MSTSPAPSPRLRLALTTALVGLVATLLPLSVATAESPAPAPTAGAAIEAARPRFDRTSRREARRVDRVKVRLRWRTCEGRYRCAKVRLPLDYDRPNGRKVQVALRKYPARGRKIGTLFINPGGPGGSGTDFALLAPEFFSKRILRRFDVVGFDPRGINRSTQVRCFRSARAQQAALGPIDPLGFPTDATTAAAWLRAYRQAGRACATTGRPLSTAMSTAQVARDLDVLRRAVGDRRLSYAGFSYGTQLGQVYANLFPDRVRALALDGVVDPLLWTGRRLPGQPTFDRIGSAAGAERALNALLDRCETAGAQRCPLAARGDTRASFALLAQRLRQAPISSPETGEVEYSFFMAITTVLLYQRLSVELVPDVVDALLTASDPGKAAAVRRRADVRAGRLLERARTLTAPLLPRRAPYQNDLETFWSVACSDGRSTFTLAALPGLAAAADRRTPYLGALRAWQTPCARDGVRLPDEDRYRGGFRQRTRTPVLFVGNLYDPATRIEGAVSADRIAPRSRIVLSDSWGHTAYRTSACVDRAVDGYLLHPRARRVRVVRCVGDYQPYVTAPSDRLTPARLLVPALD